ncbi:MAG TPA: cyclic nucleotide-binding domain-containing protein [Actinomycetota bacterium]|nr:cyclic nucleotide-binding domain-containing protein [Actinomycetota bacterium]
MPHVDAERLKRTTLFAALDDDQVRRFVDAAAVTEHQVGETLTEQGSLGHRFHLILDGAADVERDGTAIASLGPGDFVGELGLLGGGPSTATVRCTEPTRCLTLRREAFWRVLEEEPALALRILEVLSRRLVQDLRTGATANLGDE